MIHFRRSQPTAVRPPRRAGYLYVAVLFTTLIIVATVTAGLSLSTANTRGEIDRIDRMSALRLAESQLQRVATQMQSENTWRSTATNSVYSDWIALGTRVNG
ncbi:MAG: hypothetical protein HKN47_23240, partial [Pirellulaceae bacterium]|nr:hypothetical protein [Pirellulaceae bacterium]